MNRLAHRRGDREVEVGVGQDDEGVGPAQLQQALLDGPPGAAATAAPARSLPVRLTAPIRSSSMSAR